MLATICPCAHLRVFERMFFRSVALMKLALLEGQKGEVRENQQFRIHCNKFKVPHTHTRLWQIVALTSIFLLISTKEIGFPLHLLQKRAHSAAAKGMGKQTEGGQKKIRGFVLQQLQKTKA